MTDKNMPAALRFMLAARRSELEGLEGLASTCQMVTQVGQLVHALQRERGYSNMYLGSGKAHHLTQLDVLTAEAKAIEARVLDCFERIDLDAASASDRARLFNRIAYVMHGLDELPGLRRRIREQRLTPQDATMVLSRLIGGLLAVVFEAADTAIDPVVTRVLVAMFNFMQGKELAGQERACGVGGFLAGYFDASAHDRLEHLVQSQERCFQTFIQFADDDARRLWRNQESSDCVAQLGRLRGVALKTSEDEKVDSMLSEVWFDLNTLRIDAMRDIEIYLADGLLVKCQESIKQARADLDNHRQLLTRLVSLEAEGSVDQARLFSVQAIDLDSPPADGLGPHLGRSVLDLLQSQTQRLLSANDELEEARQALNERKLIERAKRLLMDEHQLSEGQAYERLRQSAMERGQRMVDVSQTLLAFAAARPAPRKRH
ncbi:nitrate regulatory protein [Pseudomonas capsici]|uniref:Nitrate- and nitrite sensing domain-containing protein n=1 Tax=Pseudomonas capsici TaxID=2810614 RepID=A0ABT3BQ56_9PSED|nr:nitrate regulatory protein [Pseudomonas capsici]MBX8475672.1 nitrate- and nitrite sensing domain-containing protein [Pseudomonas cichorii]MBN6712369.1 nitrate- and nitrite sensing domain-containing protein [Pseudomonas capsici]MBN6717894.1 nitrate- and nitrite sensing domain-containing protein [Pseudomonas capsici]MBN6723055.1 nitrate- and nitrite sensing domain-containing protein [Pseudomonas capsici]MBX8607204.1 nitrate- and nitrite sensing domain-containing protein [Pseudomonas cichorii]